MTNTASPAPFLSPSEMDTTTIIAVFADKPTWLAREGEVIALSRNMRDQITSKCTAAATMSVHHKSELERRRPYLRNLELSRPDIVSNWYEWQDYLDQLDENLATARKYVATMQILEGHYEQGRTAWERFWALKDARGRGTQVEVDERAVDANLEELKVHRGKTLFLQQKLEREKPGMERLWDEPEWVER